MATHDGFIRIRSHGAEFCPDFFKYFFEAGIQKKFADPIDEKCATMFCQMVNDDAIRGPSKEELKGVLKKINPLMWIHQKLVNRGVKVQSLIEELKQQTDLRKQIEASYFELRKQLEDSKMNNAKNMQIITNMKKRKMNKKKKEKQMTKEHKL